MKRLLPIYIALSTLALCCVAHAGQIWTDGDGDGLPDSGPFPATPSTNVTVGVWIDAQSFNWTNYLVCVEWDGDCLSYVSASYVITGGNNFPIIITPLPRPFCLGGSNYNEGGVDHIGNVTLHVNTTVSCCVSPMIDIYNPYYVFSQLGNGSAYMLFTTNPGTCYGTQEPAGACCYPDGSCVVGPITDCSDGGGVYYGDGSTCDQISCPQPAQACCFVAGYCQNQSASDCVALGGTPQGAGTSCQDSTLTCPVLGGACCAPPRDCIETTKEECAALGGAYLGDGEPCPNLCFDAVEPRSWGRIKGLFR